MKSLISICQYISLHEKFEFILIFNKNVIPSLLCGTYTFSIILLNARAIY